MKNVLSKWGFALIALTITCAVSVACASDEQSDNLAVSDEVQLLQMRADLAAEEVNDTINEEIKQVEKVKKSRYLEEFHTEPEANLFTNDELAAFEQQRQEKIKVVQAQLDEQVQHLQKQVAAQGGQNSQTGMMPKSRPPKGTVAGIVVYQKKGAALIDGRIVRENSTIKDIKVVSITKDYVEFEKQGKTWKQMVAQSPPAELWAEPVTDNSAQKSGTSQPTAPAKQTPAKPAPAAKPANGKKTK